MVPGTDNLLYVSSIGRVNTISSAGSGCRPDTDCAGHGYPSTVHKKRIYRVHYLMGISFMGAKAFSRSLD